MDIFAPKTSAATYNSTPDQHRGGSTSRSRHAMFPEDRIPSDEELDRCWSYMLHQHAARR